MSRRSNKKAGPGKASATCSSAPDSPAGEKREGTEPTALQTAITQSDLIGGLSGGRGWIFGLVLVFATIISYQQVWHAGFIWDDDEHLTENPCIIGPLGLKEIWTTSAARICPLVLTTFWIEHALWGLRPLFYHLVNVLMHAACAVLLWRVLSRLKIRGAWLGAALWALHPVQVESVAWITELKNTQSCLFYLLTILFFLKWLATRGNTGRDHGRWNYALALVCGALAMASKSSTVILPVVLGLCAWWMDGRWRWRNLAGLMPFLLLSVVASGVSMWTQHLEGANDPEWTRSWPERLVVAGRVVWFYLGKLLWPHPLIFIYPRWKVDASQAAACLPTVAVGVVLFVLWWNRRSRFRPVFFALAYFLAALLPVLGVVDHYFLRYSFVGDHFQYLASMGPLALAAAGMVWLADFLKQRKPWLKVAFCVGLLLALGALSWRQVRVYRSVETLWTDTLQKNPDCWMAYNNLGLTLFQKGSLDEAIARYRRALQITPDNAEVYNNLGNALLQKGHVDDAMAHYQKALEINPGRAEAHYNLGNALLQKGHADEAIAQYQRALLITPDSAEAHNNLGNALLQKGNVEEAITHFQRALQIKPGYAEADSNLGNALLQKGNVDEAITHFQRALQIKPNYAEADSNLGNALLQRGNVDEAIIHFQRALQIKPDYAEAHYNFGNALLQKGNVDEAITQYQKALQIKPDYAKAHNNLGSALLRKGNVDEAISHDQRALQIKPDYVEAHVSLGNALLQKGNVDEAITHYQEALQIKPDNAEVQNNLAWVLATCPQASLRNGKKAVALAQRANQLAGDGNPVVLDTLAAAYAEAGRFPEAVETARRALQLAETQSNAVLADSIRSQMKLYQAGIPFHFQ